MEDEVQLTSGIPPSIPVEEQVDTAPEKSVLKGFRLKPSEEAQIGTLTGYAEELGYIKGGSFQTYMMFCLNVTYKALNYDHMDDTLNPEQRKLLKLLLEKQG